MREEIVKLKEGGERVTSKGAEGEVGVGRGGGAGKSRSKHY